MQRYSGESDECECAQCQGAEMPEWFRQLELEAV
jgi:hypothetical protein